MGNQTMIEILTAALFLLIVFRKRIRPFLQDRKDAGGNTKHRFSLSRKKKDKEAPALTGDVASLPDNGTAGQVSFYDTVTVNLRDFHSTSEFNFELGSKLEDALLRAGRKGKNVSVQFLSAGTAVVLFIRYEM